MSVPNKYIYNSTHHKKKKFTEINNGLVMFQTGQKKIEVHAPDTVHASIVSTYTETSGSLNQMK